MDRPTEDQIKAFENMQKECSDNFTKSMAYFMQYYTDRIIGKAMTREPTDEEKQELELKNISIFGSENGEE
jgi:hypothetical protein